MTVDALPLDHRSTRAHFNHAGMSLTPDVVQARMLAHLALEAEIGGYEAAGAAADELDAVPAALAVLLGAEPDEMVATESATAASELIFWSMAETLGFGPRDRILVDQMAYATAYSALRRLELARGSEVVVVPSEHDGTLALGALGDLLDDRTRLVLVTHMPTHVGTVTDAAAVGQVLAGSAATYVLDVSQTLGQLPLDVARFGCDVAFAPARKFLRGPRGTGVLYVRSTLAEQLVPLTPPFGSVDGAGADRFTLPRAARRFDQFEYGVAARLALGEAARYAARIGLERIADVVAERSRAVVQLVGAAGGLHLVGQPDDRGIISFVHRSMPPAEVQARLSAQGVNAWTNVPAGAPLDAARRPVLPSVRLSPHYVTTEEDLDRLEHALATLP